MKVKYYDIDKTFLCEYVMNEGDCTISFNGGHGYELLKDNTKLYEFKNGPYFGQSEDKEWIK